MAAALGGGALLSRSAINKRIEKRMPVEIETARAIAVAELEKQIGQVISERLLNFTLSLTIKAGLIGISYLLYAGGHLSLWGLKSVVAFLIAVFIVRDAVKTLPFVAPAYKIVRRHRWSPRAALIEFVAGVAFERAYAETMIAMETGPNKLWIALSKYSAHSLSENVAEAVADVARSTNFENAKKRALLASFLALFMFAAYISFFFVTVGAAR